MEVNIMNAESTSNAYTKEITQAPVEGVYFRVCPSKIDKNLFRNTLFIEELSNARRTNNTVLLKNVQRKEFARQLIQKGFIEMEKYPKRYKKDFWTYYPKKTWEKCSGSDMKNLAKQHGDHIADWVEQVLEWAQRINNGESWNTLCVEPDTAKYFRIVCGYAKHRNDFEPHLVGGSTATGDFTPPADINDHGGAWFFVRDDSVPLIVAYNLPTIAIN
jgi:hypothetical protein